MRQTYSMPWMILISTLSRARLPATHYIAENAVGGVPSKPCAQVEGRHRWGELNQVATLAWLIDYLAVSPSRNLTCNPIVPPPYMPAHMRTCEQKMANSRKRSRALETAVSRSELGMEDTTTGYFYFPPAEPLARPGCG